MTRANIMIGLARGRTLQSGGGILIAPRNHVGESVDDMDHMLKKFISAFPKLNTAYPRKAINDTFQLVMTLAQKTISQAVAAYQDNTTIIMYQDQIDQAINPVARKMKAYTHWSQLLHDSLVAKMTEIVCPSFKDETVDLLLSIKAALEQMENIEAIKPWWLKAVAEFVDVIGKLLTIAASLAKAAYDVAKTGLNAVSWLAEHAGVVMLGVGGLLAWKFIKK